VVRHRIAVIAGDGIGKEVIPAGLRVLEHVSSLDGNLTFDFELLPWGSEYYLAHGVMMPSDALERLALFDAIYLGAVGDPAVPDNTTLWGLLIPIRQSFDEYVNLRPVRDLLSSTAAEHPTDLIVVRENSEGEYSGVGSFLQTGTPRATALQVSVFSEFGVARVANYAFTLARRRARKHVTSVSKGNALAYSAALWDRVVAEVGAEYADVSFRTELVDAAALHLARAPEHFDVIVASNLYGDILSDLAAMHVGSLGMLPSANLNPERRYPSLFEPVHGSAPDIAGRGIANPVGAIWSAAMMLGHLGHHEWEDRIVDALSKALATARTPDLGGSNTTEEVAAAVVDALA